MARYKNTLFGFLWVTINPLIQMLVIGFVFRFFVKEPITNYYIYLLVGLLVWNFFSLSLTKAKKAKFPRNVIPLSIILSNLVHLLVAFALLLIPAAIFGSLSINGLPNLLLGFILLISFTVGVSLLTSSLNVRFRDVSFFVQAILVVWFYITPIVYSINVIPYSLMWIWRLNPMTSILQLFQNSLASAPGPGIGMLISNITVITIILFIGVKVFRKESQNFDDWL